ncbi:O-antigen ligase family protein [Candidatus Roizmanbacteria bacterium]|nr:O-antigen ligase family protein [Candidatus Roizmanbacteria bacterium]
MKKLDNILRFLYGSLFFLTPLIFAPMTSELFEFNKMIFIYVVTILISFVWLLKMILSKKILFKKTPLDIFLVLFLLFQILSTVFSLDRHSSFYGYYGRFNGGLLSIVSYIILYYGLVSNPINVISLLKTSIYSSIFVIIWGLPGKLGHDLTCLLVSKGKKFDNSCWDNATLQFRPEDRVFSTLGQPNWLGAYLAINFFIGLYFLVKNRKNIKYTVLNTLYLLSNFIFVVFTRSRSALAAVGLGLIFLVIYYFYKKVKNKGKFLLVVVSIFTVLIGVLLYNQRSFFDLRLSKINSANVTESLDIRKIVWKGALDLGLRYPLFGTGLETFAYSYYFIRPVEHNLTSEWDFVYNKAHNEFFNYLATAGFLGLGSYLLLIGAFIYFVIFLIKNQSDKNILLYFFMLIAYLTILITNFFGFSTTMINVFFYLIPAFVFSLQELNKNKEETIQLKKLSNYQYLSIFINSIIVAYLLFSVFIYWLADTYYALGVNYSKPQISDYQKSAFYFEKAIKIRREHVYEDKMSSSLSYLAAIAAYQKQTDVAKQIVALSDYYNKKTLSESPKNIFYWKTRAKNQYLFYQVTLDNTNLNEGIKALSTGQKLAPTDPKIPYSLAVYYSLFYDQAKDPNVKEKAKQMSLSEIDKALQLKKDFQDGLTLKKELLKKYTLL